MRATFLIPAIALLGLAACSDGSGISSGGTGGTSGAITGQGGSSLGVGGSSGGGGTGGASTGTSGSIIPAGCNIPACYMNLFSNCMPSGTCVAQESDTGSALCFSDGGKVIMSFDLNTMGMSMTLKKKGAVCMSMVADSLSSGSMTVKDASGKTVATLSNSASGETVVTCTGQAAVTLNQACGSMGDASSTQSDNCTTGTCSP